MSTNAQEQAREDRLRIIAQSRPETLSNEQKKVADTQHETRTRFNVPYAGFGNSTEKQ